MLTWLRFDLAFSSTVDGRFACEQFVNEEMQKFSWRKNFKRQQRDSAIALYKIKQKHSLKIIYIYQIYICILPMLVE